MKSVVQGAAGLVDTSPCLTDIASMSGNETYDRLSQRCRNVLIEESLPSMEERKNKVLKVVKSLGGEDSTKQIEELVQDNITGSDILFPVLRDAADVSEQLKVLEIAARKQYQSYNITEFNPMAEKGALKFIYHNKPRASIFSSSSRITSMTDLTRQLSNSKLSDLERSDSDSSLQSMEEKGKVPSDVPRVALMKICNSLGDIQGDAMN